MMDPNSITFLDTETTGIGRGFRTSSEATPIGISEYSLLKGRMQTGGHTNILQQALSKKRSAQEYHEQLTTGAIQWQAGYARAGDVLAGVHERHVAATLAGKATYSEAQAVYDVMGRLKAGETVAAWNARFDIGQFRRTAQKLGISEFGDVVNEAWTSGRIKEASAPVKEFLFNLAKEKKISFIQASKSAKRMINLGKWTAADLDTVPITQLFEEHLGFKSLFEQQPDISWKQYVDDVLEGDISISQPFKAGASRPDISYIRSWKQQLIAESINPGFNKDPSSTLLGKEIARRRQEMNKMGNVVAHSAQDDVILSQILYEKFSAKDPIAELQKSFGSGITKESFIGNYIPAREKDLRQFMKTFAAERNPARSVDTAYLGRVIAGVEGQAGAPIVADNLAQSASKLPSLREIYTKAGAEARELAVKYPKRTALAGIIGGIILADALIPETNRLEGRRHPHSKYTRIRGITFEGISSPEGTDFGSGRAIDNPSMLLAYRMSQSNVSPTFQGYSIGEIETAQMTWGGGFGQVAKTVADPTEYKIVPGRKIPIPGVNQNAWVGVMDLKNYRVKAEDADTVELHRRGILHIFDKPISVRLAGIDAPEISHAVAGRGLSLTSTQPGGIASGKYLRQVIETQTSMHLILDPSRSTFGRHVGILSGDVTPNINLKMVTAGAAAASGRFDGSGSIAAYRAYEKAEAQAATSGIGIWSSKGWQAKRMMDLSLGNRLSNTSLTQMHRLATRAGLAQYYGLVENLHNSKPKDPWVSEDVLSMQYLLSSMSTSDLTAPDNSRIKEYGWQRGIRDGTSAYNIAGYGINPSGINVSAFGSGWSFRRAERVLRMVDPLGMANKLYRTSRYLLEPIMQATPRKRYIADVAVKTYDKTTASRHMRAYINTTPPSIVVPYKSAASAKIPMASITAFKPQVRDSLEYSSAYSSVHAARTKLSGWRRSKFIGANYSARMAIGVPYRPLNEYKAVVGPGFPGGWQEKAWSNFNASKIGLGDAQAGYDALLDSLRTMGISRPEEVLVRRNITGQLKYIEDMHSLSDAAKARYTKPHSGWQVIKNIRTAGYQHQPAYWGEAGHFLATRNALYSKTPFRQMWRDENKLISAIWRSKVTPQSGVWGKVSGVFDFLATDVLDPHVSKNWLNVIPDDPTKTGTGVAGKTKGAWNWVKNQVGPIYKGGPTATAIKGWAQQNVPQVLKSMGKFSVKRIGYVGAIIGLASAYSSAPEYKNQYAGAGVELAATGAGMAAWGVTSALTAGASAAIGGKIGVAVGAAIGTFFFSPGVGTATVGAIGGAVGAAAGFIIHTAVTMAASIVVDTAVREAGGMIFKKRTADPYMQDPRHGPNIPGLNTYGSMDQYLMAGHGIQGRPEFSGFGGGLKPIREAYALADTLGRASRKIVGALPPARPPMLARTRSRFTPTAGLVQCIHSNRHTAYRQMRNHAPRSMNNSRMLMAA